MSDIPGDVFNDACRTCHAPATLAAALPAALQASHTATSACWNCHMQAAGTADIPHVTFTDHWIRRRLPPTRTRTETALARNTQEGPAWEMVRQLDEGEARTADPAHAALEEALAYYEVWETLQRRPEHAVRVRALVRRALAGGAVTPDAYVALGRVLLDDSLAAAEAVFRQGASAYPRHARLAYWHGAALRRQGRPADALGPFQQAFSLQPQFLEARLGMAAAQQDAGQAAEAEASYQALVDADPFRFAEAWNNLGLLRLLSGRAPEAVAPLGRAVALDPTLVEALVNLGGAQLQLGQADQADQTFRRALRLQPTNVGALANRGLIAAQQGRRGEAIALFRQVVQLRPDDARARQMLADLQAGR